MTTIRHPAFKAPLDVDAYYSPGTCQPFGPPEVCDVGDDPIFEVYSIKAGGIELMGLLSVGVMEEIEMLLIEQVEYAEVA